MGWLRGLIMAVALAWGCPAWAQSAIAFEESRLVIVDATGRHHPFMVEMAVSAKQLAQGLMYRRSLAPDHGMLFDFGRPQPVSMWMKNTLIPLDMVFIAGDGAILGIAENTTPMSTDIIAAPGPVRAVLELAGGTTGRLGIKAGDRVVHPMFSP